MDDDDLDTDTRLAILASLLSDASAYTHAQLLDALISHAGDVPAAAAALMPKPTPAPASRASTKRKRGGLDAWLKPGAAPADEDARPRRIRALTRTPSSSSSSAPPAPLLSILKAPASSSTPPPPRLAPLTLGTPALVAQHVPCTYHPRVLPPALARELFEAMRAEAAGWARNEWWLFDRLVTSPHRTALYARDGTAAHTDFARVWYNGRRADAPRAFPRAMEAACALIEEAVNKEMEKRPREPLEWAGGPWRANVAGANCYEGAQESVGAHSDGLTYLGPYPTIASLSLGTARVFRLREVVPLAEQATRAARTFNVPLEHNSLLIMHAGCQERYKHGVPPARALDGAYACRINLTFRFFRPDYAPARVPRCACGVPAVLRPDAKLRAGAMRYWWACGGHDGPGCGLWKVMDVRAEGRGPFAMDVDVQTEEAGPREADADEEGERSGDQERATKLLGEEELDGQDKSTVSV